MKASEQFCAEVYHGLDGLAKEKEYFFGCQGRVGPFGCCCSTVMDPPLALCLFLCLGRRVEAFIRGFLGLDWPYTPFSRSPRIYFTVVYLFRSTDDVFLSLIPLVHVVDQVETGYGVGPSLGAWGAPETCVGPPCVLGTWRGGLEPIGVLPSSLQ